MLGLRRACRTSVSFLFDPLLRPRRPAAAAPFFFFVILLSGCVAEPEPPRSGGTLLLQLQNNTDSTQQIVVEVRDPKASSLLLSAEDSVPANRNHHARLGILRHGEYTLVADVGTLSREVRIDFGPAASFYRFVIEDEVLAFQSG